MQPGAASVALDPIFQFDASPIRIPFEQFLIAAPIEPADAFDPWGDMQINSGTHLPLSCVRAKQCGVEQGFVQQGNLMFSSSATFPSLHQETGGVR